MMKGCAPPFNSWVAELANFAACESIQGKGFKAEEGMGERERGGTVEFVDPI